MFDKIFLVHLSDVAILRFGSFELDTDAEHLRKDGRTVRVQPQPFKLLRLLIESAGRVVARDEIRAALWPGDTFVDYDQGVNFAIRQVREALGDDAERPVFVQTVPKRGYRFLAPIQAPAAASGGPATADLRLHKALWANIAELRLAEEQRRRRRTLALRLGAAAAGLGIVGGLLLAWLRL